MSSGHAFHPQKYTFDYRYNDKTVEYSLWRAGSSKVIRTIIFLGTVQIDKHPEWIAEQSPDGTIVVQGAPHWLASDDGSDIPEFMFQFTKEVFKTILATNETNDLRIIADSQAAPGVLNWLADTDIKSVTQLALLQPLGLNAAVFSGTLAKRVELFKIRIAKNFRYQLRALLSDRRLRYNHRLILKTLGYKNSKIDAQYGSGLQHDSTDDLKKIATSSIRIVIICGQHDMMFPADEIEQTIRKSNVAIPIVIVPGVPHSPLATKNGMRLLVKAFEYLQMNK
jgi:pimeloyl-ACP methyl ester carboxylesterase